MSSPTFNPYCWPHHTCPARGRPRGLNSATSSTLFPWSAPFSPGSSGLSRFHLWPGNESENSQTLDPPRLSTQQCLECGKEMSGLLASEAGSAPLTCASFTLYELWVSSVTGSGKVTVFSLSRGLPTGPGICRPKEVLGSCKVNKRKYCMPFLNFTWDIIWPNRGCVSLFTQLWDLMAEGVYYTYGFCQ